MIILYSLFSIILNSIIIPFQIYYSYISNTYHSLFLLIIIFNFINIIQNILIIKYRNIYNLYGIKSIFVDFFSIFINLIYLIKSKSYTYDDIYMIIGYLTIFKIPNEVCSILYNSMKELKSNIAASRIYPLDNTSLLKYISKGYTINKIEKCKECNLCSICLSCFYCEKNGDISITFCNHLYHNSCLIELINHESVKTNTNLDINLLKEITCPLCKNHLYKC